MLPHRLKTDMIRSSESDVAEFSVDEVPTEDTAVQEEAAPEEESAPVAPATSPWPTAAEPEFAVVDESSAASAEPAVASAEIDLSSEWDDSLAVETDTPTIEAAESEVPRAVGSSEHAESGKADETIEEIRFYLAHSMPEQAMAALAKLQTLTRDQAKLAEIRAEVEAATQAAAEEEAPVAVEPVVEELTADDIPTVEVEVDETPVDEQPAVATQEPPVVEQIPVVAEASLDTPEPVVQKPVHKPVQEPVHKPVPASAPEPEPEPSVLNEFVSDLETSLGDSFLPGTVTGPIAPPAAPTPVRPGLTPAARSAAAIAAAPTAPVLGEFVADIEASLGEDFLKAAPVAQATPAPPVPAPVVPPRVTPPLAASAAASASTANHVASAVPQSAAAPTAMASVAWHAPALDVPKPQPPAIPASQAPAAAKTSPFGDDAGVDLAEMFGELKQDLEADVASADEDPETHYNLGIAFREMGLLDEAIGELQKACQSFDHGHAFPQIMQTYTWLAQCFLEKGVPEAAVRWYDKALNVAGIDGETRVALHYELASAYEAAGDKASALKHFMDVYGSNIDYRDVAERIKALKS